MARARGGKSITHVATEYPYQVELRDLWGTVPLPEYELGRAAQWFAPDGRWRRTSFQRRGEPPALRWAFAAFGPAEAFHARFGGRLVDAADDYPSTRRNRGRDQPHMRDIRAARRLAEDGAQRS